jgi:serine/threonine-protein kinase
MSKLLHRLADLARELRRRKVVSAVLAYALAAAGVVQIADVVAPRMNIPERTVSVVILLALVGLPVVAALAWLYDIVPDGRTRGGAALADPAARLEPNQTAAVSPATPAAARPLPRSVAVLPFANLSADPANEYFADGITEDVISHLSKIGALSVISRTSVMPFKRREQTLREIGATLGAATLLEGSVRREGERVRVVAQLIDSETARNLWAETYDRELTDVFAIQTDVALHIAAALHATLSFDEQSRIRKEPTDNLEAYQLFLHGRQRRIRYTAEGMRESIGYFERAIAVDPDYAAAYANIAMAYEELGEIGALEPAEAYGRAREAATTALALDGELAEAHCVWGQLKVVSDLDWGGAERDFQRALELSPSSAESWDQYGRLCSALGRHDESVAMEKRAHDLDPLSHRTDYATALLRAGRLEEALPAAEREAELDPQYDRAHATLGWAYIKAGRPAEGLAELETAVSLSPSSTAWLAQLGQARAQTGDEERAREVLRQLQELSQRRYVSPYHLAYVHTGLGEYDRAIDLLERSFRERAGAVYGVKGSFLFTALHSHPRFAALLQQMNLT